MHKFDLEFNGRTASSFCVHLYDYPVITPGGKRYQTYSIPGMLGSLISDDLSRDNATIKCTFSVVAENVHEVCQELGGWLEGDGKLKFSDSPEDVYEVLAINNGGIERELRSFGRCTVTFTVLPYAFKLDGYELTENLNYNPYAMCMPTYHIKGEGVCTLNVDGNTMEANVGQNLTIDSRLMIAHRADGTLKNTSVTGDYSKLWLPHGTNNISITTGFDLKIQPKWGYFI